MCRRGRLAALVAALLSLSGCGAGGHRVAVAPPATTASGTRATVAGGGGPTTVVRVTPAPATKPLQLPARLPARTLRVPVLMYHRIDRSTPSTPSLERQLTVSPEDFAAQLAWLQARGYHALTELQLFRALMAGARLPPHPVVITFDDGYRDVYTLALPIMRRFGFHGTAYVITDRISTRLVQFLTWPELRLLEAGGIEIGSHTHSHLDLTSLSGPGLRYQLVHSRRLLESHLGHPVQWFCYPAGRFDASVEAAVRAAGYVLAVTTREGETQSAARPFELQRIRISDTTGPGLAGVLGS